jgi:hypothetical protein
VFFTRQGKEKFEFFEQMGTGLQEYERFSPRPGTTEENATSGKGVGRYDRENISTSLISIEYPY